jgi:hypothetical protein
VAYSWVTYTGDGNTTNFSITFTFISRTHVKVYLDSVESTDWSWVSDGVIAMDTAPAEGVVVRIQRETPKDSRLVTFQDAAIMTAEDQNDSADQNFMSMQEEYDNQSNYLQLGTDDKYNAQSKVIKNVADGVANTDAANKGQIDSLTSAAVAAAEAAQAAAETAQTNAETAETNAETAETNAETAETNAVAAEAKAEKWADETEDVEVETGKYSAKHWAAKAAADNPINAIHDNVDGEISAISEKATPVDADLVIIEDSEASNAKKGVQLQDLHRPDDYAANMQWGGTRRNLRI